MLIQAVFYGIGTKTVGLEEHLVSQPKRVNIG